MRSLDVNEIHDAAAHARNERKQHKINGYPCLVCGAPCANDGKAVWVWLHEGGATIVDREEGERLNADGDHGDMGAYPIGPNCYRKYKKLLQPFVESSLLT